MTHEGVDPSSLRNNLFGGSSRASIGDLEPLVNNKKVFGTSCLKFLSAQHYKSLLCAGGQAPTHLTPHDQLKKHRILTQARGFPQPTISQDDLEDDRDGLSNWNSTE